MDGKTKKVILFIVEGPTDEDTLSPVLKEIFHDKEVHFHVVHGDMTTDRKTNGANAIKTVHEHIKAEMKRYGFRKSDILKVVHLIDTDGAFITDEHVVEGDVKKLCYEEDRIISSNPQATIERNERKTSVLQRLYSADIIGTLPYAVYYFSRNMEHVLHNIDGNLSDEEKMEYADRFDATYGSDPEEFIKYLSSLDFAVAEDYEESWHFIFEGLNSLHRHSNLHLLFSEKRTENEKRER